jgi:hypothetical protein
MSSNIFGLIFYALLSIISIRQIFFSIDDVRIGKGIIQEPKYDTSAKRIFLIIRGIIGIVVSIICSILFIVVTIIHIRKTKMIGVLSIIAGIQMLLVGFGVIKNNWKNDEEKAKNEKRLRIGGLIVLVGGAIRVSMEYLP